MTSNLKKKSIQRKKNKPQMIKIARKVHDAVRYNIASWKSSSNEKIEKERKIRDS